VITDAGGRAAVGRWLLGPDPGENRLIVRAPHVAPVTFTALVNVPFMASSVVSGTQHTCAIAASGDTYCWGANDRGQVDDSPYAVRAFPTRVASDRRFVSLSAAASYTCGISNETPSQTYCWGRVPVQFRGSGDLAVVTAGDTHSCGLTATGLALCWGAGTWGQLGNGGTDFASQAPVIGATRFAALAAGAQHTCGLTPDGKLFCWGLGDHGQLGFDARPDCSVREYDDLGYSDSPVPCALVPQPAIGAPVFVSIAAGYATCGLTAAGEVDCFGLGPRMVVVSHGIRFTRLAPDGNCGEAEDHTAYCWATMVDSARAALLSEPVAVGGGLQLRSITASAGHQCGVLASDGSVVCWGRNERGQLGNGTRAPSATPLPVARPPIP
jgi:hypothetical protein